MTFKKGQKPPKKGEKLSEVEVKTTVIEEENTVSTVVENEINDVVNTEMNKNAVEEKNDVEILGELGGQKVIKPKGRIGFEAQVAPVPMFKIPADIRQYLINKGFTTDVYKKDKEWLEKHGADMKMIEKLKKFLTTL